MPPRATKKQKKDEGGPAPDVPPSIPEGEVPEVTPAQPASNGSAPVPAIGTLVAGGQGFVFGFRVPRDYFISKGWGDTSDGGGVNPWETGSYDLALEMAKIENFNVVPYTSCIPAEANEVKVEDVRHVFHHGAVLEVIQAVMHGNQGDRISAGVGMMKVRHKGSNKISGGWAAEYTGHADAAGVEKVLRSDLKGMFERRFNKDEYEQYDEKFIVQTHEVENSYGSVLVSINFCSWIYPLATASMPASTT